MFTVCMPGQGMGRNVLSVSAGPGVRAYVGLDVGSRVRVTCGAGGNGDESIGRDITLDRVQRNSEDK